MIYTLWALLNVGLFIWIILLCIKATRFIRERLGLIAAFLFIFLLFSFVSRTGTENDNKEPNSDMVKTWKFSAPDSLVQKQTFFATIEMSKNWISSYDIGVVYAKDDLSDTKIPVSANTWTKGFISGTSWQPSSIVVKPTDDVNKFAYSVEGIIKW